jgi:hypothetical protein
MFTDLLLIHLTMTLQLNSLFKVERNEKIITRDLKGGSRGFILDDFPRGPPI